MFARRISRCESSTNSRWDWTNRSLIFRLKGTVILRVWWQVLLMAVYTLLIVLCHKYVDGIQINFPLTLVPVLGVVTGLLLVFRTNTAYDRYWEGRRLWSELTYLIRNLTCAIWAGKKNFQIFYFDGLTISVNHTVGRPENFSPEEESRKREAKLIVEKTSAINLLVAFAFATKNYLRQEYSYDEIDMKELIRHLPRFQRSSQFEHSGKQESFPNDLKPDSNSNGVDNFGMVSMTSSMESISTTSHSNAGLFSKDENVNSDVKKPVKVLKVEPNNIPIEISYYLFSYIRRLGQMGILDLSLMKIMYETAFGLVERLTGLERVLGTPIPLAYGVHLHQAVGLYLLALPYQLVEHLSWFTIPAVSLAAFALLGILAIGREIENPFGYDDNDLPLDEFCQDIRKEVQTILGQPLEPLESWINTKENFSPSPNSWSQTDGLLTKSGSELKSILIQNRSSIPSASI